MIASMTGFGRERRIINGRDISVEIRSVNNRFLDFSVKLPRSLSFMEERLKLLTGEIAARGKVELTLGVYNVTAREVKISANTPVIRDYIEALRNTMIELSLPDRLSLSDIFKMPDAFVTTRAEVDEEALWTDVKLVATEALLRFRESKQAEGGRLKQDLLAKLANLDAFVEQVETLSPESVDKYRARLFEKMTEILREKQIDSGRILQEAALFSEKTAVDEETARLRAHLASLREMLETGGVIGRKVDFLIQEINREINTVGSKCGELAITRLVLDAKSELEKIREQAQNIE